MINPSVTIPQLLVQEQESLCEQLHIISWLQQAVMHTIFQQYSQRESFQKQLGNTHQR